VIRQQDLLPGLAAMHQHETGPGHAPHDQLRKKAGIAVKTKWRSWSAFADGMGEPGQTEEQRREGKAQGVNR